MKFGVSIGVSFGEIANVLIGVSLGGVCVGLGMHLTLGNCTFSYHSWKWVLDVSSKVLIVPPQHEDCVVLLGHGSV